MRLAELPWESWPEGEVEGGLELDRRAILLATYNRIFILTKH
jgi:hypothetical protein